MTFRTFVKPMFVALSLAFATTAAAPAFADSAHGKSAEHKGQGKEQAKHDVKIRPTAKAPDSLGRPADAGRPEEAGRPEASGRNEIAATASKGKGKEKAEENAKAKQFPMGAEKFSSHIETRLTAAREKLVKALEKHKVSDASRTKILKDFDDGAAAIRAAAKRAATDGSVTKDEAKEVRSLVKSLREQMRAKYAQKNGKNKDRGNKGEKPSKPAPKDV